LFAGAFSLLRRPAGPTVLPYAPLFRSHAPTVTGRRPAVSPSSIGWCTYFRRVHHPRPRLVAEAASGCHLDRDDRDVETRAADPRDRKSTRLNSSHVKMSYAVFCLKKNN